MLYLNLNKERKGEWMDKKIKAKEVRAAQEIYHCPHCGILLRGNEKFCPECGNMVNIDER